MHYFENLICHTLKYRADGAVWIAGDKWSADISGFAQIDLDGEQTQIQNAEVDFEIATTADGRDMLIAPQKQGLVWAINPDNGQVIWKQDVAREIAGGRGETLFGVVDALKVGQLLVELVFITPLNRLGRLLRTRPQPCAQAQNCSF